MFDVVPPGGDGSFSGAGGNNSRRRARPVRPTVTSDVTKGKKIEVGPRTIETQWKLPARLRKPIRSQLKKQREKKRQRDAVVRFDRKLIKTQAVGGISKEEKSQEGIKLPRRRLMNRGAEHHTGDTYRDSKPGLRVASPPYAGAAISGNRPKQTLRPVQQQPKRAPTQAKKRKRIPQHSPSRVRRAAPGIFSAERDVAINLGGPGDKKVEFDQRLFAQVTTTPKKDYRRAVSLAVFLSGCAILWLGVWNLQGVSRGLQVVSSVQEKVLAAFDQTGSAQAALADADFNASGEAFSAAGALIQDARSQLDEALAASRYTLRILDPTNTVRSGQELLTVGEELTNAGERVSAALAGLLGDQPEGTLVEAVERAQGDLVIAQASTEKAQEALEKVSSPLLPTDARQQIDRLKELVPAANAVLTTLVDQSDTYLHLLGANHDRQYLLLFANNDELRPVGGFIGTIGLVDVDRGKVENIDIKTVYDPDGQLQEYIAPPQPLSRITNRWYLRDTNWFVDYTKSARKAAEFFEKEGGPTVDGVILLTPDVIKRILAATGPIRVPGYDTEISAENFVVVTQGEVTYNYDKEENKPKQFLAELGPLLLQRLFGGEVDTLAVMESLTQSVAHKELLLYFTDEKAQED